MTAIQLNDALVEAKRNLDAARVHGDPLQIDLAESAMNSVLDQMLHVTAQ